MAERLKARPREAVAAGQRTPLRCFGRFLQNKRLLTRFLIISYTVGLALHFIPPVKPLLVFLTPMFLLSSAGLVILHLFTVSSRRIRLAFFLVLTYAVVFTLEAVGTATGLIFGAYRYGGGLGPAVAGVPLVIGLNWCLVITGALSLTSPLLRRLTRGGRFLAVVTAPACALFVDLLLEPCAPHLDYWKWRDGAPPLENYIAWAVITASAAAFYLILDLDADSSPAAVNFCCQAVFFGALLVFFTFSGGFHV